jgi:hypothetical protein
VRDPVGRHHVPPGDHRHVGRQQRHDHRLGVQGEPPAHAHHDRLARAEPPADHDLGVEPRLLGLHVVPGDDDDPARVRGRGDRGRRLGVPDSFFIDDHDEAQREPARDAAGRSPLRRERVRDGLAVGIPERNHYARLQARPSRPSISSAARGPHSPDR